MFRIQRPMVFVAAAILLMMMFSACSSPAEPSLSEPAPELGRDLLGVGNPIETDGSDGDAPEALASTERDGTDATDQDSQAAGGNDPDQVANPTAGDSNDTGSTVTVTASPKSELDVLIDELIAFVERERGHEFVSRPVVTQLDGDAFRDEFNSVIERDAERYRDDFVNFTDIYRAMGVIEGDKDLAQIWSEFGDAGVLGYYDLNAKNIVLRGGEITPFTETVLVHELTHALDDQIFDTNRPEYDDRDDEIGWTLSAILEGNARVIEERYRSTLTPGEMGEEIEARRNLPRGVSLSSFTESFRELQFGRYRYGENFVGLLWEDGVSAVDAVLVDPPTTSEVIIDPTKFATSGTEDDPAAAPAAGGTVFESGVWGQMAWSALFSDVDPAIAESSSDGWGGDWYVAWREGDQTCVRAHIQADDADALDEYAEVLERWVTLGDREIFYPTAELIRVTACG